MQRARTAKNKSYFKNRFIKYLVVGILGVVTLIVVAGFVARSYLTKDYLVQEIEKSINSEVEMEDVEISLFSVPAEISLHHVSLWEKGRERPLHPPLQIQELTLRASLLSLLQKHINVSNITIRGADITTIHREDGSTSLEELFESPKKAAEKARRKKEAKERGEVYVEKVEEEGGFNVVDQGDFITSLGGLAIENSKINITLEGMKIRLECSEVNMKLSSIKIDPAKLAETNSADLSVRGKVKIDSLEGWQYGYLNIRGKSTTQIFDPETGETEPEIEGDFLLQEDSWLNTRIPIITQSWGHLKVLEKIGIKVAPLPERATFGRSQSVSVHVYRGKITVKKPISVWVGDWELAALENSWLQTKTDEHVIRGELLASESASQKFQALLLKGLDLLPKKMRRKMAYEMESDLFRDGRLLIGIESKGDFSDPKIKATGAIKDYSESIKKAGKDFLKEKGADLLRDLFG